MSALTPEDRMEAESWDAHRMLVLEKLNHTEKKIDELTQGVNQINITLASMQTEGKLAKWGIAWAVPAFVSGAIALVIEKFHLFR
jgi:MoaA/NifB/PqqE/SkfB family radical SAM enzyme